jgi:TolA-binding protein
MTTSDRKSEAERQLSFERSLLQSAAGDRLPHEGTAQAWAQFVGSINQLTEVGAGAGGAGERGATGQTVRRVPGTDRAHVARWLMLGALGGSVVTATWFIASHPDRSQRATATTVSSSSEVVAAAAAAPAEPPLPVPAPAPTTLTPVPAVTPAQTLTAEVRAIDAARSAVAHGAADEALQKLAAYRRDFPTGQLRTEAEVVTLEALAARGDHTALARRAAAFLARHPNDPHASRVRSLLRRR